MHLKMAYADEPASLECIHKSDLFPKKSLVCEDESLQVPFPVLCGEAVEFLGRTTEGIIALSNFRVFIMFKSSFINVPLGLIETVECRDIFFLTIYCKDATVARCGFTNNDSCQEWFKRICVKLVPPKQLNEYFAFTFHAWCLDNNPCSMEVDGCYQLCQTDEKISYSFGKEVDRMKFDLKSKKAWRISYINEDFSVCPTYPKYHIVPASISDEDLKSSAGFRALRRFPSVVWRDQRNGAVIVRSSQPELGWLNWRNTQDENLLEAFSFACLQNPGTLHKQSSVLSDDSSSSESCSQNGDVEGETVKKMLVMDCRSYPAAVANRVKGGGVECSEYYPSVEVQFMNLANIHTIRKVFISLRQLCSSGSEQGSWLSALENTKWMTYLGSIIKSACIVVNAVHREGRAVLVHCSDGWDRTSQIVSLAELMLDPHYRTMEGFQNLIEREWLDFGHKFADRCGNGMKTEDTSERCPVFLQWLDCVYQLYKQFPCAFQFNEAYLVKLVQHTYSHLFGTFLCNSTQERLKAELSTQTSSVWSLLHPSNIQFRNNLYSSGLEHQVLRPQFDVSNLVFWASVYSANYTSSTDVKDPGCDCPEIQLEQPACGLQKTRSCENLAGGCVEPISSPSRRKSDPNITLENNFDLSNLAKENEKLANNVNGSVDTVPDDENTNGMMSECEENELPSREEGTGKYENKESVSNCLQNGEHCDKEEIHDENNICQNGLSGFHSNGQTENCVNENIPATIECSTDTLTEDDQRREETGDKFSNGHPVNVAIQKIRTLENSCTISTLENSCSISTSTSDISNSHVDLGNSSENVLKLHRFLYHRTAPLRLSCNLNGTAKGIPNTSSTSPVNSQAPTSTCPPTPATDKSIDSHFQQKVARISRHLDTDGLTTFSDPIQQGILKIKEEYERRIKVLESQVSMANAALIQHASACSGGTRCIFDKDDMLLSPDTNGDLHSLGSNAASDVSWENIDENESKMIRWVPDHAVTHCAECESGFSLLVRKHHCRNCGNVFCGKCTENFTAIPHQNLLTPERVCNRCFSHLQMFSKLGHMTNGIVDERPLAAAASN